MLNSIIKILPIHIIIQFLIVILTIQNINIIKLLFQLLISCTIINLLIMLILYLFGLSFSRNLEEITTLSYIFTSYLLLPIIHYGNYIKLYINNIFTFKIGNDYDIIIKFTIWFSVIFSLFSSTFQLLDIDELWQVYFKIYFL